MTNGGMKRYSNRQEGMIADYLNWSTVPASGARDFHPGDIVSDRWLGECKTHEKPDQKIIFKREVWKKLRDEAQSQFKCPALFVDDGSQRIEHTWVMIPEFQCKHGFIRSRKIQAAVRTNYSSDEALLHEVISSFPEKPPFLALRFDQLAGVCICSLTTFKEEFGG